MEETIAAISTPIGPGGIAIVRMSGAQVLEIADAIFRCSRGRPSSFATHTIHYGSIYAEGRLLDQVLLSVMRAPKTYTREDVVEINCHGGTVAARSILSCCLRRGARLAAPGEFTKRAFLNGRIDLTQAEAVMDLIQSQTARAAAVAVNTIYGTLSQRLQDIRRRLVDILAELEVSIDFPEEGLTSNLDDPLKARIGSVLASACELLEGGRPSQLLRNGISVALIGRTNAGKSSLMNAILGKDRVIVSSIPGTTRDIIEEVVDIKGFPIKFIDTAGIRNSKSTVEKASIEKTRRILESSDLVLHVVDSSTPYCESDLSILSRCERRKVIIVLNKSDRPSKCILPDVYDGISRVSISAKYNIGIDLLVNEILRLVDYADHQESGHMISISIRQENILNKVVSLLTELITSWPSTTDRSTFLIHKTLEVIDECIGSNVSQDVIESVFDRFCLGK